MAEEQLIATIRAELSQFRQGMEEAARVAQDASRKMKQSSDEAASGFVSMEKAVSLAKTTLAAFGVTVGLQAVVKLGTDAVQAAVKMESLTTSLKALTGGAEGAQSALEFVRATANRLGQDFGATVTSFQQLIAASRGTALEGDRIRTVFTAVSQATRTLGVSANDTSGIFTALVQSISKGTVQSEELRGQIGERLPGAFNIAARAMGVTTSELGKLLEAGQVITEDFLPKFARQLQKELGQGSEEAAKTAQAAFARLGNETLILSQNMGKGILALLQPLAEWTTTAIAAVNKVSAARQAEEERLKRSNPLAFQPAAPAPDLSEVGPERVRTAEQFRLALSQRQDELQALLREQATARASLGKATGSPFFSSTFGSPTQIQAEMEGRASQITRLEERIQSLKTSYEEFLKVSEKVAKQSATGFPEENPLLPKLEDIEKFRGLLKELDQAKKEASLRPSLFPDILPKDAVERATALQQEGEERVKTLRKTIDALVESFAKSPGFLETLEPKERASLKALQEEYAGAQRNALKLGETRDSLAEQAKEAEQAARAREREDKQFAEARLDLFAKAAKAEAEQAEAATKAAFEEVKARSTALAAQEDYNQAQEEALARLDQLEARSISQFEGRRERLRQQVRDYETAFGATERSAAVLAKGLAKIDQDETRFNAEELKKQQKDYEQFAAGVTRSLSDKLFDVLSGKVASFKDLLGSIKDTFLRVLADMVAAAAVTSLFGTSGSNTGFLALLTGNRGTTGGVAMPATGGGLLGSLFRAFGGGQDTTTTQASTTAGLPGGTSGGGGGVGGTLSSIYGYGKQIYNLYNAIFGGSTAATAAQIAAGQSVLGGGSGAATAFYGTEAATAAGLFGAGTGAATLGATAPTAFYGTTQATAASLFGSGATSGATSGGGGLLASALGPTAGGLVAGAGYGVGTGLAASQLLSLAGLHGTGNTTLAGATGGAVAGAYAGSVVFPGVGTAVGAIVGAVVGAIGGFLAGVLGKEPAPPGFTAPAGSGTVPTFSTNQLGQVIQTTGFRPQVGGAALSAQGLQTIQNALHDVTNQVIDPVVKTLRQFPKEFQERATVQLNALGESLKTGLGTIRFSGEDFAEQFKTYLEKDLPDAVHRTFDPFTALLDQLGPVFANAQNLLQALRQQEAQILNTISGVRSNLEEAGLSNLAIFKRRREQLADLLSQFTPETPENQRQVLGGQITALVSTLGGQGAQLFRGAGDDEGLRVFKQGLYDALNQVEQDTRNIFGGAISQTQEQLDILTGSLSAQQSMESLLEGVNVRLDQIAQLLAPVGSFQTQIGQVRRIPRTGLAMVHQGELIGRPVGGLGSASITVNVDARGATDPAAVGRTTASAIRAQLRAIQQSSRYRQDGGGV
jgi:tape measure domain-containing protein